MPFNDLLLRAAQGQRTKRTPVWLMRQAGRTDPAYVALRERADLSLEDLFRNPELAAEISLLPRRLGVDALILFQDILTPLAPMGARFVFRPGPVLESKMRTSADTDALHMYDPAVELGFVTKTLQLVKAALNGELPLLGFAGAPLTLALFLLEGGSPGRDPHRARSFMRDDPAGFHRLLDKLADMTADYLALQIDAGVHVVQLFESCADLLTSAEYARFAHPYHVKIFSKLAGRAATILFVKEQPFVELMATSGADVLSVGTGVDLADAGRRFGESVAFQGNVDNRLIADGSFDDIDDAVRRCIHAGGHRGHILNLNHGLLPHTPFDNVRRFIATAKATVVRQESSAVDAS